MQSWNLYDVDQGHSKNSDDTKDRDFVGRGGVQDAKFWRQSSEPTPVAGKTNFWEDTDDGHEYKYNFSLSMWVSITGFS
ncbi:hypothetical protein C4571_02195 [Candidatus Parcubacteria bacterium]|nr:MAG: hypothetical protein C4571_02195 [Candidatus Parcubacteria bacterium]